MLHKQGACEVTWPHDGVWPIFQEKKRKGEENLLSQPYQGHSGTLPFIDHLSRDTHMWPI